MVVRDIFRGGTALLGACRIFASRPIILLPALFRLPLLALVLRWLYDTLLWVLPDVLLRAAVSVLVCAVQITVPRIVTGFFNHGLAAALDRSNGAGVSSTNGRGAIRARALLWDRPVVRPLWRVVWGLFWRATLALGLAFLALPALLVLAPTTVLFGTVALVPAVALVAVIVPLLVCAGGSALLWNWIGRPLVVVSRGLGDASVEDLVVLAGLVFVAWSRHPFYFSLRGVVRLATDFHFSLALTNTLLTPLAIRRSLAEWSLLQSRHRWSLFGFGFPLCMCFGRWPLASLAAFELMQGAAGTLVGEVLLEGEEGAG